MFPEYLCTEETKTNFQSDYVSNELGNKLKDLEEEQTNLINIVIIFVVTTPTTTQHNLNTLVGLDTKMTLHTIIPPPPPTIKSQQPPP